MRELVSFELAKEIEKDAFVSSLRGIKPQTFGFRAPMLNREVSVAQW